MERRAEAGSELQWQSTLLTHCSFSPADGLCSAGSMINSMLTQQKVGFCNVTRLYAEVTLKVSEEMSMY